MAKTPQKAGPKELTKVPAVRVRQWLDAWADFPWDDDSHRRKPSESFYVFSLSATVLRGLCGIYRRKAQGRESAERELNTQRRHEPDRSKEIARYIRNGFPWSTLSQTKQKSSQFNNLRKPGWLPTALVINILLEKEEREGVPISKSDCLTVAEEDNGLAWLTLPDGAENRDWKAKTVAPVEVIDGQHRLLAFDEPELADIQDDYQFPVVAFVGLDRSWQAYLFYTINIKPKKINSSLAFDLYPLLRTEDWLEKIDGAVVYRETRAQELVDLLYRTPTSPWHNRINMLGESGEAGRHISQSSWVRALLESLLRPGSAKRKLGGLFASKIESLSKTLEWTISQQAAVLMKVGDALRSGVKSNKDDWSIQLRNDPSGKEWGDIDLAFYGPNTLLNQDQGVRALMLVVNDILCTAAAALRLDDWAEETASGTTTGEQIAVSADSLAKTACGEYLEVLGAELAEFDWRSSSAPGLDEDEKLKKSAFRGSSGYRLLRTALLSMLKARPGATGKYARQLLATQE